MTSITTLLEKLESVKPVLEGSSARTDSRRARQ